MNDESRVSEEYERSGAVSAREPDETTARLDSAELAQAWAKKKGRAPCFAVETRVGARTDMGLVRENNEDKFDFFEPDEPEVLAVKGSFYAVADGMGGHASGQIASEVALKTILKNYYADADEDVEVSLRSAFAAANSYIYGSGQTIAERSGMGTTCTAAVIWENEVYIAQVGDSRAYLIRDGLIRQITGDHSWVAEQVKRGALTEEQAVRSPFRNVITRSLGAAVEVEVDIYREELRKGDTLLLCSDGLTGHLSDEEILELAGSCGPSRAALRLVERANERGGGDNITVLIVSILDVHKAKGRGRLGKLLGRG